MQRGDRCVLTEPTGERFDRCFVPDLTPSGSSRSRLRRQAPDYSNEADNDNQRADRRQKQPAQKPYHSIR